MRSINNQSTSISQKTPIHIWLVGIIALFLNSIGGYDFVMTLSKNNDYFSSLGYGTAQIDYFNNYPLPLAVFWFVGVWAAIAGSLFILLRLKFSKNLFLIAIVGQVVLDAYTFFFKHRWEVLGPKLCIQDLVILGFTIFLAIYSSHLAKHKLLK